MAPSEKQAKHEPALISKLVPFAHLLKPRLHREAANDVSMQTPGVNAQDFVAADRIQVKYGSLFIDPYLVIHPHELAPEREATLRKKLQLTYSINNPSFYESPERLAIALNLGQLVPVSLDAKRSKLMEEVKTFNTQADSGVDAELLKADGDKRRPFAAIVRDTMNHPQGDPVGVELLKNGLSIYLLAREKLTQQGYMNKLSDYVLRSNTPDQVLADLSDKIGVSPQQVREAALKGGVDGVGQLLGLDAAYVKDVKALTAHAATQDFGYNLIEHWHLGRQLLGVGAPLKDKITTGIDARITAKIAQYRAQVRHQFEVPVPVKAEEKRIAEALNFVEPIQRALLYKLGYEICFSPEVTADDIAFHRGIYGLHRKAANDLRDVTGTYRIYFSGKGDLKGSMRTLVHEVAHNLWPDQFSAEEVAKIDALAMSDQQRFAVLNRIMDEKFPEFEKFVNAHHAGNEQEKAAIAAAAREYFAPYGVTIDEGILPYVRDAQDFKFMVKHAVDTLSVEGMRYNRSGYDSPQERFREVISRFAELKQVEHRSEPQLLHFLAPGLDQVFEAHYLPHLHRAYRAVEAADALRANPSAAVGRVGRDEPAANDAVASVAEQPKVVERPARPLPTGTPVQAAADAVPLTMADAGSMRYDGPLSAQRVAAMNTLHGMGVV
ncbi:MAG: hypothetical protein V4735_04460 [Pseudomonadota bacterium]